MKTIAERLTEIEYYPNKSWVKHQGARVLKPAGTSTPTDFVWSYVERRDATNYTGNPVWTGKQHLMSNSVPLRKIEDSDWQGIDWSVTGVNGAQQPTITIRYMNGGGVSDVRTWQEFSYDNGMRMTDQKYVYALNGAGLSAPTFTLANQVYNYKDQLVEKNIGYRGNNNALQSIDYQYNQRGWLTKINDVGMGAIALLTPSMQGTGGITKLAITPFLNEALQRQALEALPPVVDNNADLYSQVLTYENPDSRTQALPQKNGNISSTIWQVAGKDKQAYGFQYDELNRLTEATYFDITGSSSSPVFSSDNKFRESVGYDLRGNIVRMQRNGLNTGSWTSNGFTAATYGMIDNMVYQYGTGNRLQKVTDYSLATKGFKYTPYRGEAPDFPEDYTYDANGNLKTDRHKKILGIDYNHLNLPMVIRLEAGTLEFVYDATGTKLRKVVKNGQGVVTATYDYVNGVEYKDRILQRVAHSEGAVIRNDYGQYQHEYVLRDHLGNTRVTFRDGVNKGEPSMDWNTWQYIIPDNTGYDDGVVTTADMVQENHYYPFGMNMEGNWNGAAGNNKYQYNGKEWNDDFGLGWNDYGARWYDPAIARWNAIDPLAEKYSSLSPYVYAINDPILMQDFDGRDIDPSKFKNQKVLRQFLETKEGFRFASRFAKKGDELKVDGKTFKFTKDGDRSKDMLLLRTDKLYSDGVTRVYANKTNDVTKLGSELKSASKTTDISKGVTILLQVQEGYADEKTANTLGHEAFVHADKNADGLDKLDASINNGSLTVGMPKYEKVLNTIGNNAGPEHKALANGQVSEYKNFSAQMDKMLNTIDSRYQKLYKEDVKDHARYK
jgi:RHS repeat-associated protein